MDDFDGLSHAWSMFLSPRFAIDVLGLDFAYQKIIILGQCRRLSLRMGLFFEAASFAAFLSRPSSQLEQHTDTNVSPCLTGGMMASSDKLHVFFSRAWQPYIAASSIVDPIHVLPYM